jgi:sugar-phosphatase
MDGTIVDSTAVVEALWRRFSDEHGVDPGELLAWSQGRRTPDIVHRFLPAGVDVDTVVAELQTREMDVLDGIVEVRGAATLLTSLALPWAVVTSAPRDLAVRRMVAAGLPVPEVLVAAEDVEHGKPSPDGYLRAAELLGTPAQDCVAFEDAEPGLRAALDAGARVVAVGPVAGEITRGLDRVGDLRNVRIVPR